MTPAEWHPWGRPSSLHPHHIVIHTRLSSSRPVLRLFHLLKVQSLALLQSTRRPAMAQLSPSPTEPHPSVSNYVHPAPNPAIPNGLEDLIDERQLKLFVLFVVFFVFVVGCGFVLFFF